MARPTPTLAVGPVMPGWGSWDWVGTFLTEHLRGPYRTSTFAPGEMPTADVVVVVKHAPAAAWVDAVTARSALVYCPIDWYGAASDIAADAAWLRKCARVVVHCRRLVPHFAGLAETSYADHPVKYAVPTRRVFRADGPLLWVGVRSNLPPLVAWANAHPLPGPLDVLTNPADPARVPSPADLGFAPGREVRVHAWSPELHRDLAARARAALDVKGDDFRARHKPPAKALDFVASGVPLALEPGSSAAEHLAALGLTVPSPHDHDRWLSEKYWAEVRRVGERVSRELAPERVAARFLKVLAGIPNVSAIPAAAAPISASVPSVPPLPAAASVLDPEAACRRAEELAAAGDAGAAEAALAALETEATPPPVRARARNARAALAAAAGDLDAARAGFAAALVLDPTCEAARTNLAALDATPPEPGVLPVETPPLVPEAVSPPVAAPRAVRVAVLSLLFNWPSTGGGNVHTAELTKFLAAAGYTVTHLYARYEPWGVGRVTAPLPHPAEAVPLPADGPTAAGVVAAFRRAVDACDPDWVVLTDSWNLKPLLAAAAGGRPYVLRLQALECLCPLNNVRLLPAPGGGVRQCTRHQLATPDECARCVRDLDHTSGDLHRAERAVAGVGTPGYAAALRDAFAGAAAVLAVNPLTAAMVEPHAREVRVVTAGMDPARFPWPPPADDAALRRPGRLTVLFAGLTHEWMKGFHVLRAACDRLWAARRDFEVVATDAPPDGAVEPWVRYVGWQSQADLPRAFVAADVVVVPTVAQEALGRTAVEAMAAGRPVVASRLGGLPFTVADGATGLLCEPGDPADLAAKLAQLLDDAPLRARLGAAGRRRFEEHYAWPAIIDQHYRPLFGPPVRAADLPEPAPVLVAPAARPGPPPVLVVVSHYAGRPIGPLVGLLDSMTAHPAGAAYAVRVVVNRDGAETVKLPDRHHSAEVVYRPNAGYNIGAWEAGWRAGTPHDAYLFVQDECRVVRGDWVAAFQRAATAPGVGLVGECPSPDWDAPWAELAERYHGHVLRDHAIAGRPAERVACYLDFFARHGIPPGEKGDHLQSLVLFATRAVLERVGGLPQGRDYGEAIAAEIGASKKVQAAGLSLGRVGPGPFHYIEHPQWLHRRAAVRPHGGEPDSRGEYRS